VSEANRHISIQGGFTLLEILVVLVIATLLFTLIPPLFSGALPGVKLKGAARDLAVVMRDVRSQAIITNTEQTIHLDTEAQAYHVGSGKPAALPEGITITMQPHAQETGLEATQPYLRFFPDGSSSGGQFILQGGSHSYQLDVDWLTGSIQLRDASARGS
jgi:general secretion pathway protein H